MKATHQWEVTLKDGTYIKLVGSLRRGLWLEWVAPIKRTGKPGRPRKTGMGGGVAIPGKVVLAVARLFEGRHG
jgi:hypothetical protein